MLCNSGRLTFLLAALMLPGLCLTALPGCGGFRLSSRPDNLVSPYEAGRPVVWAVAPFRNESGHSSVDVLALADALANEVQQIEGVTALPLNRTIQVMEAMELPSIGTPSEAVSVAKALGADAILVGSVSAWDPYSPPSIGMTIGLFARSETMRTVEGPTFDPIELQAASTDQLIRGDWPASQPVSAVAQHLDASHYETMRAVRSYAASRTDPTSGLGWKRYTMSMRSFTQFACFHALEELVRNEHGRMELIRSMQQAAAQ